jgi:hypothetical protein
MAPWTDIAPTTFTRPLGENETFIQMVADSIPNPNGEHWAINASATVVLCKDFPNADFEARLRRAWCHLRFQHPSIAARLTPDQKSIVYEVPDLGGLDDWVGETLVVDADAANATEAGNRLRRSPYTRLIYVRKSGELLFRTNHWRSDGVGVFLLLNALLDLVIKNGHPDPGSLLWGEEVVRLAPCVEDAASLQDPPTAEQTRIGKSVVESFISTAGGIGIPYLGDRATGPGCTVTAQEVLSVATTRSVVDTCKHHGISVASAVHASVAAANYALAETEAAEQHYTSTVRFSLRPHLPAPYSGPSHASSIATTGWMDRVESGQSWMEHARHYSSIYRKGLSEGYVGAHRAYAAGLVELLGSLPADLPIQSDVDVSSMGIIEDVMGVNQSYGERQTALEVTAVNLGVELSSRQGVCYVWTFRDRMSLSVVYNEAYHDREQMERFVGVVKERLLVGLGVQE